MKPTKTEKPNYYGIMPASVRYDKSLPMASRVLYTELSALTNKDGFCWATNAYFANLYEVAPTTISEWINMLKERGHIMVEISDGTHRRIWMNEIVKAKIDPSGNTEASQETLREMPKGGSAKAEGSSIKNTKTNTTRTDRLFDTEIALPEKLQKIEGFGAKWNEWLAYRKKERMRTTDRTIKAHLKELLEASDPIWSLDNAMDLGWQYPYPPKRKKNNDSKNRTANSPLRTSSFSDKPGAVIS